MISFVRGDILDSPYLIVHQCNCRTTYGKGLSKQIFDRFPSANIYGDGTIRIPGTIIIRGQIVNLMGQDRPGKPTADETKIQRQEWFLQGLNYLSDYMKYYQIEMVAFPFQIGCGLAGGDWSVYLNMIQSFADRGHHVIIYQL